MKILVIAPHADDETLGCGGVIAQADLCDIAVITDSNRKEELHEAMKVFSSVNRIEEFDFIDGCINNCQIKEIATCLSESFDFWEYDRVFIPYRSLHQDHQMVHHASLIALRGYFGEILEYEYPEGLSHFSSFEPNIFVEISRDQLDLKIEAMNSYSSQVNDLRCGQALEKLAGIRGYSSNVQYAEAFRLLRNVETLS